MRLVKIPTNTYIAGSQNNTRVVLTRNEKLGIVIKLKLMSRYGNKSIENRNGIFIKLKAN